MVIVGNTNIQVDTFINERKHSINEVDSNLRIIDIRSLSPKVYQENLEDKDKQKVSKRISKKKELRPITGLLNNNIVFEKPVLVRKLL